MIHLVAQQSMIRFMIGTIVDKVIDRYTGWSTIGRLRTAVVHCSDRLIDWPMNG